MLTAILVLSILLFVSTLALQAGEVVEPVLALTFYLISSVGFVVVLTSLFG